MRPTILSILNAFPQETYIYIINCAYTALYNTVEIVQLINLLSHNIKKHTPHTHACAHSHPVRHQVVHFIGEKKMVESVKLDS